MWQILVTITTGWKFFNFIRYNLISWVWGILSSNIIRENISNYESIIRYFFNLINSFGAFTEFLI